MECPRCDAELVTYTLEGVTAVVCESCGYADVPAELDVEPRENETWEEAFERFRNES
ncbi:MAG: zf-TFIIB domain-containing protein [Halobacteriales archaeon]